MDALLSGPPVDIEALIVSVVKDEIRVEALQRYGDSQPHFCEYLVIRDPLEQLPVINLSWRDYTARWALNPYYGVAGMLYSPDVCIVTHYKGEVIDRVNQTISPRGDDWQRYARDVTYYSWLRLASLAVHEGAHAYMGASVSHDDPRFKEFEHAVFGRIQTRFNVAH